VNNSIRTTKKVLLAVGVIIVFVAYSFVLRGQRSGPIVAPSSLSNGNNQSSNSGSGSSGSGNGGSNGSGGSPGNNTPTSYNNGTYTGSVANAYYGNVQVSVIVNGGKITDVKFVQYPNDNPNSQYINSQATPYLRQEAIQAQSANVDGVSGATLTSQAFIQSLTDALNQAKA
jgi:uncharacterized protein with FMN-binding domain